MKKITMFGSLLAITALIGFASVHSASAQMMGGYYNNNGYAPGYMMNGYNQATTTWTMSSEEVAGYAIVQKLQSKTLACSDLSQGNYESLGEYYMGLMMGSAHEAMDQSIQNRFGAGYLNQMHIAMGERFSGCNTNVQFPAGMMGFGPMMGGFGNGYGMMNSWGSGWNNSVPGWNMMSWYGGYSWFGIITTVLIWALLVIGIVALVKFLKRK